jgi:hypothetical protein
VFSEQEYLRLVDLRDDAADPVQPHQVPRDAVYEAACPRGISEARISSTRRSRRGLLAAVAIVGGGLAAAVVAAVDQVSTPRIARQQAHRRTRTERRGVPPRSAQRLRGDSAVDRARRVARTLPARLLREAGRWAPRSARSPRPAQREVAVVGREIVARRGADAPPTPAKTDREPRDEPGVGVSAVSVDRSRKTADFTFER